MLRHKLCFGLLLSFFAASILEAQPEWREFGRMESARSFPGVVALDGGRVLVMGGSPDGNRPTASVELLDLDAESISTLSPMNTARSEFVALVASDGSVIVVSGAAAGAIGTTTVCERYDPGADTWTEIGNLNVGRRQFQAQFISDSEILVIGGDGEDLIARDAVEIFDINSGTSTNVTSYPFRINEHVSGFSRANTLLVAGGRTGGIDSRRFTDVYTYNRSSDSWLKVSDLPEVSNACALLKLWSGNLMISGGTLAERELEVHDLIFHENNNEFRTVGRMQHPRYWHGMAQWNKDSVLISGGFDTDNDASASTDWLHTRSFRVSPGPDMAVGRAQFATIAVPDRDFKGNVRKKRLLAIGGISDDGQPSDLVEIIDEDEAPVEVRPIVINRYTAVTKLQSCPSILTVDNPSGFRAGDKVLLIQSQGAEINDANSSQYGSVINANHIGNYEFNRIADIQRKVIVLQNALLNSYSAEHGLQLVSVPEFDDYVVGDPLAAKAWDGSSGGVIALAARGTVTMHFDIDASGAGYRGGELLPSAEPAPQSVSDYRGERLPGSFAARGEGIAGFGIAPNLYGRGAAANGGGGGNNHNAGGGGGSNKSCGGRGGGGDLSGAFPGDPHSAAGIGGHSQASSPFALLLGGGGGAGHQNDDGGSAGAAGGGIVIIQANELIGNGNSIRANGHDAGDATADGAGGGGAGGTIQLDIESVDDLQMLEARGGRGGNVLWEGRDRTRLGPGGGGGGGRVVLNKPDLQNEIGNIEIGGGSGGLYNGIAGHGAAEGCQGQMDLEVAVVESDRPNTGPRVSLTANELTVCEGESVLLEAAVSGANDDLVIAWEPEDGLSDPSIANPLASPSASTLYTVTVSDGSGCSDVKTVYVQLEDCRRCDRIAGVINSYSAVRGISYEEQMLRIAEPEDFTTASVALLIQMQGAEIVSNNDKSYGGVRDRRGAGDYEFVAIDRVVDDRVYLTRPLLNSDYRLEGRIQLVRVPEYNHVIVDGPLSCPDWNGTTGGVLALLADCLMLEGSLDVSGRGFRGGAYLNQIGCNREPNDTSWVGDGLCSFSPRGEGIASYGIAPFIYGKGSPANAGGGGNNHNAGGGGGANFGAGGLGGFGVPDRAFNKLASGQGGHSLGQYYAGAGRLMLGGGGGAGHVNHGHGSGGARGGGIVIVRAAVIKTAGPYGIFADGSDADDDVATLNPDGCGGGGAGGSIVLDVLRFDSPLTFSAAGGNGGSKTGTIGQTSGPGGGGGGGIVAVPPAVNLTDVEINVAGGMAGSALGSESPGAQAGDAGSVMDLFHLKSNFSFDEHGDCRGCYPVVAGTEEECGKAIVHIADQSILLESAELLDDEGTDNVSLQIVDNLPANESRLCIELNDTLRAGRFHITVRNAEGRSLDYRGTILPKAAQPTIAALTADTLIASAANGYQWIRNGWRMPFPSARQRRFHVSEEGDYQVEITDENGCTALSEILMVRFTGIAEQAAGQPDLRVLPNPGTDIFHLATAYLEPGPVRIRISDALGRTIRRMTIMHDGGELQQRFSLADQAAGLYFVHLENASSQIVRSVVKE